MTNKHQFNFSEHKNSLIKLLEARGDVLGINEPISLIDGFMSQPIQQDLCCGPVIGGASVPMVAAVGNISSRIYFFALKHLIPNVKI